MNPNVIKFLVHTAIGAAFSYVLASIVRFEVETDKRIDDYFDEKQKNDNPYLEN